MDADELQKIHLKLDKILEDTRAMSEHLKRVDKTFDWIERKQEHFNIFFPFLDYLFRNIKYGIPEKEREVNEIIEFKQLELELD